MDTNVLNETISQLLKSDNIDQAVAAYIKIRDAKKALEAAQKQKLAGLSEQLTRIENWIMTKANEQGVENFKTANGTAYKNLETSVTVADWERALTFVRDHEMWHMLEHKLNKTAVMEYTKETKQLPPGINMTQIYTINVRRDS